MFQADLAEQSLSETKGTLENTRALESIWSSKLRSMEAELARLVCEASQLKDCNSSLHEQV